MRAAATRPASPQGLGEASDDDLVELTSVEEGIETLGWIKLADGRPRECRCSQDLAARLDLPDHAQAVAVPVVLGHRHW